MAQRDENQHEKNIFNILLQFTSVYRLLQTSYLHNCSEQELEAIWQWACFIEQAAQNELNILQMILTNDKTSFRGVTIEILLSAKMNTLKNLIQSPYFANHPYFSELLVWTLEKSDFIDATETVLQHLSKTVSLKAKIANQFSGIRILQQFFGRSALEQYLSSPDVLVKRSYAKQLQEAIFFFQSQSSKKLDNFNQNTHTTSSLEDSENDTIKPICSNFEIVNTLVLKAKSENADQNFLEVLAFLLIDFENLKQENYDEGQFLEVFEPLEPILNIFCDFSIISRILRSHKWITLQLCSKYQIFSEQCVCVILSVIQSEIEKWLENQDSTYLNHLLEIWESLKVQHGTQMDQINKKFSPIIQLITEFQSAQIELNSWG